eukprot:2932616-Prymnesium_polylepis.1
MTVSISVSVLEAVDAPMQSITVQPSPARITDAAGNLAAPGGVLVPWPRIAATVESTAALNAGAIDSASEAAPMAEVGASSLEADDTGAMTLMPLLALVAPLPLCVCALRHWIVRRRRQRAKAVTVVTARRCRVSMGDSEPPRLERTQRSSRGFARGGEALDASQPPQPSQSPQSPQPTQPPHDPPLSPHPSAALP